MHDGKWIHGLKPAMPLREAGRKVLELRLGVVQRSFPRAAADPPVDPEHVHQLRVATRRSRAALELFASCLPDKLVKTLRRDLRRIRRVAGDARDLDVFLGHLSSHVPLARASHLAGIHWLAGQVVARRSAAQRHLRQGYEDHHSTFSKHVHDCIQEVQGKAGNEGDSPLRETADRDIASLLSLLEEAVRGRTADYAQLHQVRIQGKRLRYSMEVFGDLFPAAFREQLYPRIEEMQDILGRANDCHVGADLVESLSQEGQLSCSSLWSKWRPGLQGYRTRLLRRLSAEERNFDRWWKRWEKEKGSARMLAFLAAP
jgi:CHAD domain-containing protein